jgi:hypothetical protein
MIQDINKNFSTLKEALGQSIIFHVSSQTSLEYIVKQGIALARPSSIHNYLYQ